MDEQIGFDPTKRRLCSDGTCTGIIGPDGRCGECGLVARTGNGDGGANGVAPNGRGQAPEVEAASPNADDVSPPRAGGDDAGFDPNRRLCDDGACVGVIGPNGACAVCGRVAG